MQPSYASAHSSRNDPKSRANRWVAATVGLASLPWLAAGELGPTGLGIAACITAGIVAWLPEFGRPVVVGVGFFVAVAITSHPLLAGNWHPWQAATSGDWRSGDWGIAAASLICLPCLLMVVARTWALELLDEGHGCNNRRDDAC